MKNFADEVVLITGASSGIGKATALELADRGARVMLAARREDRLQQLTDRINKAGGTAEYCVTDVTRRDQVERLCTETMENFGTVTVLFANAGIMPLTFMKNLQVDDWDATIDVNLKGMLYTIAGVMPEMLDKNRGHIITVSSIAGHKVLPSGAVYCGTKYAVRAISEGLRQELHPETNIRVTIVSPGAVSTELTESITDPDAKAFVGSWELTPIKPDAIARAVAYAIEQPADVDVNEVIVRPTSQQM